MEREDLAELVGLVRELIAEVRELRQETQRQGATQESAVDWLEKIEQRISDA
jgi:hypothetical protein